MILYECNQHKRMISYAFQHIESYLPLTQETYSQFSPEEIGFIDQFLFRFSKRNYDDESSISAASVPSHRVKSS
jgi:hypothetical protein